MLDSPSVPSMPTSSGGLSFSSVVEVLPQSEGTRALMAKMEELAFKQQQEHDNRLKEQEERDNELHLREQERQMLQHEQRKRLEEEERRKREEDEQRHRLETELQQLIGRLHRNETPPFMSLTGMPLDSIRFRLLMQDGLMNNESVSTLSMVRRGLHDEDGEVMSAMLIRNVWIQSLDLEGNHFGSNTARALGKALQTNDTLLSLTLDNNCLTDHGMDSSGFMVFADSLRDNRRLRVLNLYNNGVGEAGGEVLCASLEVNPHLTQIDLGGNSISVQLSRKISHLLNRNRQQLEYVAALEASERQRMAEEEVEGRALDAAIENKRAKIQGREERRLLRLHSRMESWRRDVNDREKAVEAQMDALVIEYEERKESRMKAKRAKKAKGSKKTKKK